MKYLVHISRIIVGALFIFSGLIKLNDPLGFSYKLEEYFSADVLNIPVLEPYALGIAVVVVVLEVVLGVFLLIGYKPKFTVWSLLAMIVFFTFLTFYAAYFEKVKDCGCFGDFMKLEPWESFYKDLVLLILIVILVIGLKHIKPLFGKFPTTVLALLGFLGSLWFGYHVLMHLPTWDFRAYKVGANIQEGMLTPEDAPKPILDYFWKFNVNGEEKIITTQGSYPEVDGEFIGVETEEIQAGYTPPIQDFSIESEDEDLTQHFLTEENLIVVVSYNLRSANSEGFEKVKKITDLAIKKGCTVIGLTSSDAEAKEATKSAYNLGFDFYLCDEKVLKTIVRSNPGVVKLQKGTVIQKVHFNDVDDLTLETLPNASITLNLDLKRQLDSVMVLDQKYRMSHDHVDWNKQQEIDSSNTVFIENVFRKHGYPGKSLVGEKTNSTAWYVIQHSNKIAEYLPLIKEASNKNELPKRLVAMMEDRYLMGQGKKQIYGTQGSSYGIGSDKSLDFIWPIEDLDNVDSRRKEIGFDSTLEEYAKNLFGENFVFKDYTLKEVEKIKNSAFNH